MLGRNKYLTPCRSFGLKRKLSSPPETPPLGGERRGEESGSPGGVGLPRGAAATPTGTLGGDLLWGAVGSRVDDQGGGTKREEAPQAKDSLVTPPSAKVIKQDDQCSNNREELAGNDSVQIHSFSTPIRPSNTATPLRSKQALREKRKERIATPPPVKNEVKEGGHSSNGEELAGNGPVEIHSFSSPFRLSNTTTPLGNKQTLREKRKAVPLNASMSPRVRLERLPIGERLPGKENEPEIITHQAFEALVKNVNEKTETIKRLKTMQVYSKKHDLRKLEESRRRWRDGCREALGLLLAETSKRIPSDRAFNLANLLVEQGIPFNLIGFDPYTMEYDTSD